MAYAGLALAFTATVVIPAVMGWPPRERGFVLIGIGLEAALGLLLFCVTSATSLAEERARGSLDVLLATPISTRSVVLGKWLGTFRLVPRLLILPALAIVTPRADRFWDVGPALLLCCGRTLADGAAVASLGLAMATWIRRPGRALAATVGVYILVTAGWFMMVLAVANNPSGAGLAAASPFYGPVYPLVFNQDENVAMAVFWLGASASISALLLLATLATFDRCLGRISGRPGRSPDLRPALGDLLPATAAK
jgi:ABC-type transport system involved in multi-copper enzyme maturation permease subunit